MSSWLIDRVKEEQILDLRREAEQRRLRKALAAPPAQARFYTKPLVGFGRRMVAWGYRLQSRYGALAEVPIAPSRGGSASRC
jgi:hypothetical protein